MSSEAKPRVTVNSWLAEELYQEFINDQGNVDASWKELFDHEPVEEVTPPVVTQAVAVEPVPAMLPALALSPAEHLVPIKGAPARIAENMTASLGVPTATSQRTIPVKVIDENRRLLNQWRDLHGKSKISYTHLIAWAIVKAIHSVPGLNDAYAELDGQPHRLVRPDINIGIAVDVAGKDGHRSLLVPSIKGAGAMGFYDFLTAFDALVARSRSAKLTPADFQGTTVSLTNPGTVGTLASVPRLMPGQGAIIATGSIDFPPEFLGVSPEMRAQLGICKVMTMSCTYDHRVIQGAESGQFLGKLQALLEGADGFYDEIFRQTGMPYQPFVWQVDRPAATRDTRRMEEIAKQAAVLQMINAYRVRGHLIADLNPLGVEPGYHPELDPSTYGLTIWDFDREFITGNLARGQNASVATLREIIETLRQTYCGRLGCEYMHIQHPEEKRWLQERMEPQANHWPIEASVRRRTLLRLLEAESFENFLHTRFVGQKRFSLEGGESAMVILGECLEHAAEAGMREIFIGMAHRGRLTVLANLVGKSMSQIFGEFEGNVDPDTTQGSGDVKYHLGASGVQRSSSGKEIKISLSPNPSHLEAVNPVVEGIVRAKQTSFADTARDLVLPVLVHGDAAFAGQGVVVETLNLSQLKGYSTGGSIHLVINNQIGFTSTPEESRSSTYCTDVARTVQAPILHVNGDDPEACVRAIQIAFDYRMRFHKDVVIDMICYRRYGHNEGDDPSYTQPLMYKIIRAKQNPGDLYAERLRAAGVVAPDAVERIRKQIQEALDAAHTEAQRRGEKWELQEVTEYAEELPPLAARTAVEEAQIEKVVAGITTFPGDFTLHPKLKGFIEKRKELLRGGTADWATAEALAFGTLVLDGTPVRLSGQDSGRGTFSQRHLEYFDYETGQVHTPMAHLDPRQARFEVYDSSLSEYGVMGFEFGYSLGDPLTLTLWEAQFGDFANGAQIMIDQFIASCQAKWGQPSGLVLLLPHGYEGQGPEHSSARIERYLQLCAEDNLQAVNPTTPAQYFHLLRRQMYSGPDRRGRRKPLVVFTPKSLLRHAKAVSTLADFTSGQFQPVRGDSGGAAPDRVSKIVFCSGRIYYDLVAERARRQADSTAIIRLEQLYPWPTKELEDTLWRYPSTAEIVWAQDEPRNQGAYLFVRDRLEPMLEATRRRIRYAGRPEGAAPSTGTSKRHAQEQAAVFEDAFSDRILARPRRYQVVEKQPAPAK
jgi:2-oxoglutarate dehydrogenase E1 component